MDVTQQIQSFLQAENLTLDRGGRIVLRDISFTIQPGECIALIGPNGVGKTSLLSALMGLLPVTSGQITLNQRPLVLTSRRAIACAIAYVPQLYEGFTGFTVHDLVAAARYAQRGPFAVHSRADEQIITDALHTTGLTDFRERLVSCLSGGERQKVFLAAALAQQSPALFLDEPTTALDPHHQQQLITLLQQLRTQGRTILFVSHDLNLALMLDARVLALANQQLLYDEPAKIFVNSDHPQQIFQADFQRITTPTGQERILLHV
ncbi:MAG: Fe(3+) dicitrate transport ATP-binding protein FecE [Phycisphaerae bacterium]|nr:Fe(3+) dicitrate transport ATP-binding protein FecE [Phycisphaerae bacterium]